MILLVLRFLRSFEIPKNKQLENLGQQIRENTGSAQAANLLSGFLLGVEYRGLSTVLPVETDEEIRLLIAVRDKIFFILRSLVKRIVTGLSFYTSLNSEQEKREYKRVCQKVFDFYLKKVLGQVTSSIKKVAEEKNLRYDDAYEKIGASTDPALVKIISKIMKAG